MASFEEALTALVLADPEVADLVGDRVHWLHVPPGGGAVPYLTIQGVGGSTDYTADGETGLDDTRVQFDYYGASQVEAQLVGAAVRGLLSGYAGTVAGVEIQAAFLLFYTDMPAEQVAESERRYRATADYRFRWKLAA